MHVGPGLSLLRAGMYSFWDAPGSTQIPARAGGLWRAALWRVKALLGAEASLPSREEQGLGGSTGPGSDTQPGPGHLSQVH